MRYWETDHETTLGRRLPDSRSADGDGNAIISLQVKCGGIRRSSALPQPPSDGTPSASVWPLSRQTLGPAMPMSLRVIYKFWKTSRRRWPSWDVAHSDSWIQHDISRSGTWQTTLDENRSNRCYRWMTVVQHSLWVCRVLLVIRGGLLLSVPTGIPDSEAKKYSTSYPRYS